ncbi:MAG: nucleoside-diphosphate-sugar epimerase [Bermanella sp.]|jgi:nucleoside-diphosphate-sugar epimerase
MHAFVTGATGFVGQHLIEYLLSQGWQVTALYRNECKIYQLEHGHIQWQLGALHDIHSLRRAMPESVDAIFHLASDTSTWSLNHRRQYQTNVMGTQNLAKVALEKNAIRFIHTSSIAIYGFHDGAVDEHSEKRGIDSPVAYYRTKYLAEEVIHEYIKKGLDAVILNPAAIIGSKDSNNWVRLFNCIDDGTLPGIPPGRKSFCFVEDVAKAQIQAFIHGRCGENYILSGPSADFSEVYHWVAKQLNKKPPAHVIPSWLLKYSGFAQSLFSHITRKEPAVSLETAYILCANVTGDCEKAQRELQYKNQTSLEDMLQRTLDWWQSEREQPNTTVKKEKKAA